MDALAKQLVFVFLFVVSALHFIAAILNICNIVFDDAAKYAKAVGEPAKLSAEMFTEIRKTALRSSIVFALEKCAFLGAVNVAINTDFWSVAKWHTNAHGISSIKSRILISTAAWMLYEIFSNIFAPNSYKRSSLFHSINHWLFNPIAKAAVYSVGTDFYVSIWVLFECASKCSFDLRNFWWKPPQTALNLRHFSFESPFGIAVKRLLHTFNFPKERVLYAETNSHLFFAEIFGVFRRQSVILFNAQADLSPTRLKTCAFLRVFSRLLFRFDAVLVTISLIRNVAIVLIVFVGLKKHQWFAQMPFLFSGKTSMHPKERNYESSCENDLNKVCIATDEEKNKAPVVKLLCVSPYCAVVLVIAHFAQLVTRFKQQQAADAFILRLEGVSALRESIAQQAIASSAFINENVLYAFLSTGALPVYRRLQKYS